MITSCSILQCKIYYYQFKLKIFHLLSKYDHVQFSIKNFNNIYIKKIIHDVDGKFSPLIEFSIQRRNFRSTLRLITDKVRNNTLAVRKIHH